MQNQPYAPVRNDAPLSMGNFLGSMFITFIPIVGLIMLIVWACSSTENVNKRNWARAYLLYNVIISVIVVIPIAVFGVLFYGTFAALLGGLYY